MHKEMNMDKKPEVWRFWDAVRDALLEHWEVRPMKEIVREASFGYTKTGFWIKGTL